MNKGGFLMYEMQLEEVLLFLDQNRNILDAGICCRKELVLEFHPTLSLNDWMSAISMFSQKVCRHIGNDFTVEWIIASAEHGWSADQADIHSHVHVALEIECEEKRCLQKTPWFKELDDESKNHLLALNCKNVIRRIMDYESQIHKQSCGDNCPAICRARRLSPHSVVLTMSENGQPVEKIFSDR